jgi:hypothetical protein
MKTNSKQLTMFKPGIYSPKQLFTATIIGGPVIAGFIMAMNLWARGKRWMAIVLSTRYMHG